MRTLPESMRFERDEGVGLSPMEYQALAHIEKLEEELRQVVIFTKTEGVPLREQEIASIEKLIGPVSVGAHR